MKVLKMSIIIGILSVILASPFLAKAHEESGTIHLYEDSYDPQVVTIYKGEQITFENASDQERWPDVSFQSTPKHQAEHFSPDNVLGKGGKWKYKFDYAGVWQYTDKKNPAIHGEIYVILGKGYSNLAIHSKHKSQNWWTSFLDFFSSLSKRA